MNKDKIDHTLQRAIKYRFADGILEIAMGAMSVLLGIYFYIQAAYPESQVSEFLTGSFLLFFVIGWYALRKVTESLKHRLTYPRTGYVAYREAGAGKGLRIAASVAAAAVVAAGLAYFQLKAPPLLNFMPLIYALLIAVTFGFLGFKTDLARFIAMAFISLILGALFAVVKIDDFLALAGYLVTMGVVMLASGGLNLRHYMAMNPAQSNTPEEHEDER